MALITDPDLLNQGTELNYATVAKTLELAIAGNLSADGVVLQAGYSFSKEEWLNDAALAPIEFPFNPITDEFFQIGVDPSGNANGWTFLDQSTRNLIRRSGWEQFDSGGLKTEHWAGLAILGAESDDQIYYDLGNGVATDFVYLGNTAEAVQVIDDPNGDGNYADGFNRSANITAYNRQQGQLYSVASTSANGEASLLAPKLFSLTLNTGADLNITANDVTIAGSAPWNGMSITYFAVAQTRNIGGNNRDFGVIIDGNGGTAEQIYEFVQWALRQNSDIDGGASGVIGKLADELLRFTGGAADGTGSLATLSVTNPQGGGSGVYIDNFQAADTNRIAFIDNTATLRTFPFVAVDTISFNLNLQNDTAAKYWVFFENAGGNQFGTSAAILVDDNSGADVTGLITGAATIQFDFDYDNNVQGGRVAGTDANIVVVAIGLDTGQYVRASGVIQRSITNTVTLTSNVERQYQNAA